VRSLDRRGLGTLVVKVALALAMIPLSAGREATTSR